ncbi:unnamed protein product [Chrysoparadoxa australica]
MEPEDERYNKADYIRTTSANLVSRAAKVYGAANVNLKGKSIVKPGAIIRGELAAVRIGRYCMIAENAVIRPPYVLEPDEEDGGKMKVKFKPLLIGNSSCIGKNSVVEAGVMGTNVHVGDNCVLGASCTIHDNCYIEDGAVLPPGMVVPPFSRIGGIPARILADMPESTAVVHRDRAAARFDHFKELDAEAGSVTAEKAD